MGHLLGARPLENGHGAGSAQGRGLQAAPGVPSPSPSRPAGRPCLGTASAGPPRPCKGRVLCGAHCNGHTARMGPGRSPRRGTPLLARLPWEAAVATWVGMVGLRTLTEPQRRRSRQGAKLRSGGPRVAPFWGRPQYSPPTEGSSFLGGVLRPPAWLPAAALRTLVWERQQTQWRRQPGRPLVAPKTPAWAQRQQAQRLWQRQPHLPTIPWSRTLGPSRPAEAHRPPSSAFIDLRCSLTLQRE